MKKKVKKKIISEEVVNHDSDDIELNEFFSNLLSDVYEKDEEQKKSTIVYEGYQSKNIEEKKKLLENNRTIVVRKIDEDI